jgi:hypothetical protein
LQVPPAIEKNLNFECHSTPGGSVDAYFEHMDIGLVKEVNLLAPPVRRKNSERNYSNQKQAQGRP